MQNSTTGKTSQNKPLKLLILAAGHGMRMRSRHPKCLHPLAGLSLLGHCLKTARELETETIGMVIGPEEETKQAIAEELDRLGWSGHGEACISVQKERLGTGHALKIGFADLLTGFRQEHDRGFDLVMQYADTPLVRAASIQAMREESQKGAELVVLAFEPQGAGGYGRVVLDSQRRPRRIVEVKNASPQEKAIGLCNSGLMLFSSRLLESLLPKLVRNEITEEYYATDLVELAYNEGLTTALVKADAEEVLGVNSQAELAEMEALVQQRLRRHWLKAGVVMPAPETVFFSHDSVLDREVLIEPYVVFGPGVRVKSGARIRAFSHLEGCEVEQGASIGPFARIRPLTRIGNSASVGNFVEVKNSTLGEGARASHLSYLGDAVVGAESNIGAGTITCNYDGFSKWETRIGKGVFVGSNTALVAPIELGDGAIVGAGSTLSQSVEAGALAVARAPQKQVSDEAGKIRKRKKKQVKGSK